MNESELEAELQRLAPVAPRAELESRIAEELRQRLVTRPPGPNRGPIGNQPAKHRWTPARHDLRLEPLAVDVLIFGDRPHES